MKRERVRGVGDEHGRPDDKIISLCVKEKRQQTENDLKRLIEFWLNIAKLRALVEHITQIQTMM